MGRPSSPIPPLHQRRGTICTSEVMRVESNTTVAPCSDQAMPPMAEAMMTTPPPQQQQPQQQSQQQQPPATIRRSYMVTSFAEPPTTMLVRASAGSLCMSSSYEDAADEPRCALSANIARGKTEMSPLHKARPGGLPLQPGGHEDERGSAAYTARATAVSRHGLRHGGRRRLRAQEAGPRRAGEAVPPDRLRQERQRLGQEVIRRPRLTDSPGSHKMPSPSFPDHLGRAFQLSSLAEACCKRRPMRSSLPKLRKNRTPMFTKEIKPLHSNQRYPAKIKSRMSSPLPITIRSSIIYEFQMELCIAAESGLNRKCS
ncbi:hypothetical protein V5799_013107 [Amblyomma americanum]|uniref:Uncharacterized protein n=1 Tax=Amblyomma americanum TaxID=6943 RepID=A0AAQ4E6S6_AMBAM